MDIIQEMLRVCAPGGTVAITDTNPQSAVMQNLPALMFTPNHGPANTTCTTSCPPSHKLISSMCTPQRPIHNIGEYLPHDHCSDVAFICIGYWWWRRRCESGHAWHSCATCFERF